MTREESNWILSRTETWRQLHRMRKSGWPQDSFVGLQLSDQEEALWQVWKIQGTEPPQKTADFLMTPEEVILELEAASAAWRTKEDELGIWEFEDEIISTMIAELMGFFVIDAGNRIVEATKIAAGISSPGNSDPLIAAQMAWHSAAMTYDRAA